MPKCVSGSSYFVEKEGNRVYYDIEGNEITSQSVNVIAYSLDPDFENKARPSYLSFEYLSAADSVALFFMDKSRNPITFIQWPYDSRDRQQVRTVLENAENIGVDVEYVLTNLNKLPLSDNASKPCTIL